ncbi:MAG: metalloregulator ArsR/SmtB family transcription factor, partial [Thermoanaerobaculia bacterium]
MESEEILISEIFKALSSPLRIKILKILKEKNICQCEFASLLNENPVNISRAFSGLVDLEIVEGEKRGNKIFPKIKNEKVFKLLEIAEEIAKEIASERVKKYS